MILCNIIGGLGNQMFQYAAGRALSLERGVRLALDVSDFAKYRLHQGFELKRLFNCPVDIASASEVDYLLGWRRSALARRILLRPGFSALRPKQFVVEPNFHYWSGFERLGDTGYLTGYWQSEKYFRRHRDVIREDFRFLPELDAVNASIAKEMAKLESVSLHVRRGDYVNNPKNLVTHGLCSPDYYKDAVKYLANQLSSPVFFVFSDDIPWVKSNLDIGFPTVYVDHNSGEGSYNDMRLMSVCKHNIIANSSFSWWGAWLNENRDKIVVAPRKWFVNDTNTSDLFPEEWILM